MSGGERHHGGCLCGAVRFAVHGPLRDLWLCHCGQCRKWTGNSVAATAVRPSRFELTAGEDVLTWYSASPRAERGFCGRCGSSLFWRPAEGDRIGILAGAFDGPATGLTPAGHCFVAQCADWEVLADGLPRHDGPPPSVAPPDRADGSRS